MTAPKVAALVINYNGRDVTLEALKSLTCMNYPNYDVIVVDNGSSDGSPEAVTEAYPYLKQVVVEKNEGYARGMNEGLRWTLAQDYDYVLMLNNDIEVEPEMLTLLVEACEADETIGVAGPKCYYYWDRERIWSAGGDLRFGEAATRERGMGEVDRGQYDRDEEVGYINGAAMLVPMSVLRKVGLWNPLYHLANEDADWTMRMRACGYRSWYVHEAILWHMVSHTTGNYTPGRTFATGRGMAIFVRSYGGPWQWLSFVTRMAVALPLAFLRELPKGNQGAVVAKLRGVIAGLKEPLTEPPHA